MIYLRLLTRLNHEPTNSIFTDSSKSTHTGRYTTYSDFIPNAPHRGLLNWILD